MPKYSEVFAGRLKEERQNAGMSQAELAERTSAILDVNLDASAISRIENPNSGRMIKLDEAAAAAEVLGIALSALVSNGGRVEARIAELHHKLSKQSERASGAEWEFHQAQAAMVAIEHEIAQLEEGRGDRTPGQHRQK